MYRKNVGSPNVVKVKNCILYNFHFHSIWYGDNFSMAMIVMKTLIQMFIDLKAENKKFVNIYRCYLLFVYFTL